MINCFAKMIAFLTISITACFSFEHFDKTKFDDIEISFESKNSVLHAPRLHQYLSDCLTQSPEEIEIAKKTNCFLQEIQCLDAFKKTGKYTTRNDFWDIIMENPKIGFKKISTVLDASQLYAGHQLKAILSGLMVRYARSLTINEFRTYANSIHQLDFVSVEALWQALVMYRQDNNNFFSSLFSLKKLDLSGNQLMSFNGIGLESLKRLDLSHNQLVSFNGKGLNSLKQLALGNNPLKNIDMNQLPKTVEVWWNTTI